MGGKVVKKQLKKDFNLAGDTRDPEVLTRLSKHESEEVRWAVAANSDTPVDILQLMVEDSDSNVKRMAMERLGLVGAPAVTTEPKPTMFMATMTHLPLLEVSKVYGMVYASHSSIAWGGTKQSQRLDRSTNMALVNLESEAKKLGANAILGLSIAINSSEGASAALMGSSEGVLAYGTAVQITNPPSLDL